MKLKKLLAVAVAAAFAVPFAAQASADSDRLILAQASGASSVGSGPTGGTPSTQSAGEPKAPMAGERPPAGATSGATSSGMSRTPDFSAIDKNGDGMISRAEWDAYQKSAGSAASGATSSGSGGKAAGQGPSAPSSDTATSPSTSGRGRAQ